MYRSASIDGVQPCRHSLDTLPITSCWHTTLTHFTQSICLTCKTQHNNNNYYCCWISFKWLFRAQAWMAALIDFDWSS